MDSEERKNMKAINMNMPGQLLISTDGISYLITLGLINGEEHYCESLVGKHRMRGDTVIASKEKQGMRVELFNMFDIAVLDAITSIVVSGSNKFFNIDLINKVITGDSHKKLTQIRSQVIIKSIEKMMTYKVTFACGNPEYASSEFLERNILPVEKVQDTNEQWNCMYEVKDTLPLYDFAKSINQVLRFPISINDVPVSDTETSIGLRSYLLRMISISINERTKGHNIVFETIYERLHLDNTDSGKTSRFRLRQSIMAILDFYAATDIYRDAGTDTLIVGYEILGKGKNSYKIVQFTRHTDVT